MIEAIIQQVKKLLKNATYGLEAIKNAINGSDRTLFYQSDNIASAGTLTLTQTIYLININISCAAAVADNEDVLIQTSAPATIHSLTLSDQVSGINACFGETGIPNINKIRNDTSQEIYVDIFGYYYA